MGPDNARPEIQPTAAEERVISTTLVGSFLASILTLLLFAWLAEEVFEGEASAFDTAVRSAIHAHANPALTIVMSAITHLGDPLTLAVLALFSFAVFWHRGWKRGAAWIALTMAGALVLDNTLKLAFHRPRPVAFFGVSPRSYSFPSGHALGSFCFYATLAALIAHRMRDCQGRTNRLARVVLGITAAALIGIIGFSRIYLGVHYPTDVIAGYIAAAIWVSALVFADRFRQRFRRRDGLSLRQQ